MADRMVGARSQRSPPSLNLTVRTVRNALRQESWAFYILIGYVTWEYWRPQRVWPVIDMIPWGEVTVAACVAGFFLNGERGRRFHGMDGLLIAFTAWAIATIPFAWDPNLAVARWAVLTTWVVMYFLVSHMVVTPRRLLLFWLAFMVLNLKMSQHGARNFIGRGFTFQAWGSTGSPVWFENSGEFAMGMTVFFAMSIGLMLALRPHVKPLWFWLGIALLPSTALLSVLSSSSRGGQLATLVVILLLVGASRVKWKGVIAVSFALMVGWQLLPAEQKDRFSLIGTEEDATGEMRLIHWEAAIETIQEHPIFGVGYENWLYYYSSTGPVQTQEIHNTFLEAPAELGIPGGLLFLALIAGSFVTNRATRRRLRRSSPWGDMMKLMSVGLDLAMVGLMIASFFMSVLFWPVYWMAFALTVSLSETSRRLAAEQRRRMAMERRVLTHQALPATVTPASLQPSRT